MESKKYNNFCQNLPQTLTFGGIFEAFFFYQERFSQTLLHKCALGINPGLVLGVQVFRCKLKRPAATDRLHNTWRQMST